MFEDLAGKCHNLGPCSAVMDTNLPNLLESSQGWHSPRRDAQQTYRAALHDVFYRNTSNSACYVRFQLRTMHCSHGQASIARNRLTTAPSSRHSRRNVFSLCECCQSLWFLRDWSADGAAIWSERRLCRCLSMGLAHSRSTLDHRNRHRRDCEFLGDRLPSTGPMSGEVGCS